MCPLELRHNGRLELHRRLRMLLLFDSLVRFAARVGPMYRNEIFSDFPPEADSFSCTISEIGNEGRKRFFFALRVLKPSEQKNLTKKTCLWATHNVPIDISPHRAEIETTVLKVCRTLLLCPTVPRAKSGGLWWTLPEESLYTLYCSFV